MTVENTNASNAGAGASTGTTASNETSETAQKPATGAQGAGSAEGQQQTSDPKAPATGDDKGKPADKAKPAPKPEPIERETRARVELQQRTKALDAREAKVKLAEADHGELSRWRELKAMAKEDSLSVLEELGLDIETVFKHAKEGKRVDPTARKALAETAALKKQLAEEKAAADAAKAEAEGKERRTKLDGQITGLLKSDGDRFELTLGAGADGVEAVHDALVAYTRKSGGRPPDPEKAKAIADNVEKFYRAQADRYDSSKYLKGKRAPKPPEPKAEVKPESKRTLDNSDDASARVNAPPSPTNNRPGYLGGMEEDIKAMRAERAARDAKESADGR